MIKSKKLIDYNLMQDGMEINDHSIRLVIREILKEQNLSLNELSRRWGMSPALLSDFLNAKRPAGPKIIAPLGLEKVVRVSYRLQPQFLNNKRKGTGARKETKQGET